MTYRIQTYHNGQWHNAWRNIAGISRALEMQQELEYGAGIAARVLYPWHGNDNG